MTGQWNRFWALAVRDGLLVALTLVLWHYTLQAGPAHGAGGYTLHLATGLMTVVCGFFLHEWGHLVGAWMANAAFVLPASVIETPFLFRFNNVRNSVGQFTAMSMGGFVASIVFVGWLPFGLPGHLLATTIAEGLTALGVLATLIIEVPGLVKVMRGAPMPNNPAFVSDPITMAERARASRQAAR
jgi:hypothetical protein